MKKLLFIIILALISTTSNIVSANSTEIQNWNQGVEKYSNGDYKGALETFLAMDSLGYSSADLYLNIGNSYFKLGNYVGKSILYYERAIRLKPSSKDIKYNLELAKSMSLDKIEEIPDFILVTWIEKIGQSFNSNIWALLAILLFLFSSISYIVFKFGKRMFIRKLSFIKAIFFLFLTIVSILFSLERMNEIKRDDLAIILSPISSVKSSPNENGTSLLILHEGSKVKIIEELGEWLRVELLDGRQGWILKNNIEII